MSKNIHDLTKQIYGSCATQQEIEFAKLIIAYCIWSFGETRFEPSLEKYILTKLGIEK
jgi:hypothetical protein